MTLGVQKARDTKNRREFSVTLAAEGVELGRNKNYRKKRTKQKRLRKLECKSKVLYHANVRQELLQKIKKSILNCAG